MCKSFPKEMMTKTETRPAPMNDRILHCEEVSETLSGVHMPARMDWAAARIPLGKVKELATAVVEHKDDVGRDEIMHTLLHEIPGEKMWDIKDVLCGTEMALVTPDGYVYGAVMDRFYSYIPLTASMWVLFRRTTGRKQVNEIIWEWLASAKTTKAGTSK